MDRRNFLGRMFGLAAVLAAGGVAEASTRAQRRRRRRRVRRRIRRRIRRRVAFRTIAGRRWWVVPAACAVGWELAWSDRAVVVKEIRVVEADGAKTEIAVVEHADGKTEEVPLVREDTKENAKEMEGTRLPDDDTTTPAVEREEEVEEEVPEAESAKEPEDRPKGSGK